MRSFAFPRRFSAAIVAFSTLNLLPTSSDRSACLARLAAALEPGAALVMDLATPRAAACGPGGCAVGSRFLLPPWGHVVEKVVEQRNVPGRETVEVRYDYAVRRFSDGRLVDRLSVTFELARVERAEVESLLYGAGFDVEGVEGDYRGTPFRPDHARMIVRGRRLG